MYPVKSAWSKGGTVPQLRFHVTDEIAETLNARAKASGRTLSSYLAKLVEDHVAGGWPSGFFDEVVGGWKGRPLRRAKHGRADRRVRL